MATRRSWTTPSTHATPPVPRGPDAITKCGSEPTQIPTQTVTAKVPYYPAYDIPASDIRADLVPTGTTDHSPSRGDADVFDLRPPPAHGAVSGAPLRQLAGR